MALIEKELFETRDKVKMSIARLQEFEPKEGYYLAFSGGKDSIVIKHLADLSGVKYTAHYNFVGIDPPPLLKYIRKHHAEVEWHRPEMSFYKKIVEKGFPPMRQIRWCCEYLKENSGQGLVVTGVRWAESVRRQSRKMFEQCNRNNKKMYLHPIIDWTDAEVWEFINAQGLPYCELYDQGYDRIGCLMCPMATDEKRAKDAELFPGVAKAIKRAFNKLIEKRAAEGKPIENWPDGDAMFHWWMNPIRKARQNKDQQCFPFMD